MTFKRLLPLLRGLFGLKDDDDLADLRYNDPEMIRMRTVRPAPRDAVEKFVPPSDGGNPLFYQLHSAKKVHFLSRKGKKMVARICKMTNRGEVILRRAGHSNAPAFARSSSTVFLR